MTLETEGGSQHTNKMTSIWFNSDIWFYMEQVVEVVALPNEGAEVRLDTGDVITITFSKEESNATVRRVWLDKVDIYTLGELAVRYNLSKVKLYAIKNAVYKTSPLARAPATEVDYTRMPGGMSSSGAFGRPRTRQAVAAPVAPSLPSPVSGVERQDVTVPEWGGEGDSWAEGDSWKHEPEEDADSSSDYEPAWAGKVEPPKKETILTIRMAVGGGDDANIDEKLVDVDLHLENIKTGRKLGRTYRIDFKNGAYMLFGKGSITYVRPNGTAAWAEWKWATDYNDTALWLWDQNEFERPAFE